MQFGDLTYQEIKGRAAEGYLAIVPTGCTEQQGPHLPVDFDTWFAEQICLAASEKSEEAYGLHSLVLPAMPFGPTPEHRNYGSGYIDIPADLHEALLFHVLESLASQGFGRIIVWRGCGQHDFRSAIARFNDESNNRSKVFLPELPYHDIWMSVGDPDNPGGHADAFTTSLMLYLRPSLVRPDKIFDPKNLEVQWNDPHLDFSRYSSTGVIGDPTAASAELGKRLWVAIVEKVARIFNDISSDGGGNADGSSD
jgi:creatinine amidohydrolase